MGEGVNNLKLNQSPMTHPHQSGELTKCLRVLLYAVDAPGTPENLREPIKDSLSEAVIEIEELSPERGFLKLVCQVNDCNAGCTLLRFPDTVQVLPIKSPGLTTVSLNDCIAD